MMCSQGSQGGVELGDTASVHGAPALSAKLSGQQTLSVLKKTQPLFMWMSDKCSQ